MLTFCQLLKNCQELSWFRSLSMRFPDLEDASPDSLHGRLRSMLEASRLLSLSRKPLDGGDYHFHLSALFFDKGTVFHISGQHCCGNK